MINIIIFLTVWSRLELSWNCKPDVQEVLILILQFSSGLSGHCCDAAISLSSESMDVFDELQSEEETKLDNIIHQ